MQCRTCTESDPNKFALRNKTTGKRNTQCKKCFNEWRKTWYRQNKQYYIDNSRENYKKYRARNRENLAQYLRDKKCSRCPEDDSVCLDFHHLGNKIDTVSDLSGRGAPWEKVLQEIQKCIILCSNCHRKEHRNGELVK